MLIDCRVYLDGGLRCTAHTNCMTTAKTFNYEFLNFVNLYRQWIFFLEKNMLLL